MDCSRERGQGTASHEKLCSWVCQAHSACNPTQKPAPFLPVSMEGLAQAKCLMCWERGKLLGTHKTETFPTKNNTDSQIALDIYKIWELFPAVCLREKHKYPPFLHTFSNCHDRRPRYGTAGLTQPTPATFSCSPAQGPQSQVHGTEQCLNRKRYQDRF